MQPTFVLTFYETFLCGLNTEMILVNSIFNTMAYDRKLAYIYIYICDSRIHRNCIIYIYIYIYIYILVLQAYIMVPGVFVSELGTHSVVSTLVE